MNDALPPAGIVQPPAVGTDIPSTHWAHAAIRELAAKGLVLGFPEGRFLGDRSLTRYELAALTKRLLDYLATNQPKVVERVVVEKPGERVIERVGAPTPKPEVTRADLEKVQKLVSELRPELAVIGADLKGLKERLAQYDQTLIDLQQELKDVREVNLDQQKTLAALQKLHFSGYLQLRYDALQGDPSLFKAAGAGGTGIRPTTGAPHVGGPSQGFILRRGRFKIDGTLNPLDSFAFQFDFGTAGPLHLRDMWADVRSGLPHNWSFRIGQFPPPFTYILMATSRLREAPERALGFSDSSNANFIFKDAVSATGGTVTAGTVIPLLINQDRDQGAMFTYKAHRATSQFGLFNGEGRDNNGQRPINNNLTFMGRVEQRIPTGQGDLFVGGSRYDGQWPVRGAAPVGGTVAEFKNAARRFNALETRWVGKNGLELRYERIDGRYDVTPDRSLFLANNNVHSWYTTLRQPLSAKTVFSLTYDVFNPTNQTVAGVSAQDYTRRTLQGGFLHQLAPGTRLRLWYVQGLTPYDPSAAVGSAARKRMGQLIGEVQVEY